MNKIEIHCSIESSYSLSEREYQLWGKIIDFALATLGSYPDFEHKIASLQASQLSLSLTITDNLAISKINEEWRGKAGPTNVLSMALFDDAEVASAQHLLLGDIVISSEQAQEEALAEQVSLSDHMARLLVHGFLHILGLNHTQKQEASFMRQVEDKVLQNFHLHLSGLTIS